MTDTIIEAQPEAVPSLNDLVSLVQQTIRLRDESRTALEAKKTEVRTWNLEFAKDSWKYADDPRGNGNRDSKFCGVWEMCAKEAGVPGRPKETTYLITGRVGLPLSRSTLAEAIGYTRMEDEPIVKAMWDAVPEDKRVRWTSQDWRLTLKRDDLIDALLSSEWDPLDKRSFSKVCICRAGRKAFRAYAERSFGRTILIEDVDVQGCPASNHAPVESDSQ